MTEATLPHPHQVASAIPRISPIAHPVRQCRVAEIALRVSAEPVIAWCVPCPLIASSLSTLTEIPRRGDLSVDPGPGYDIPSLPVSCFGRASATVLIWQSQTRPR